MRPVPLCVRAMVLGVSMLFAADGWAQTRLTPANRRITDEAIARDYRTLGEWRQRVDALPSDGVAVIKYQRSKAQHWMTFVESEYADNERGPVIEAALERVITLVTAVEAGSPMIDEDPTLPGTTPVRPDLHEKLSEHKRRVLSCAPDLVGEFTVKLISAAHAPGPVGRMNAAAALRRVEAIDATLQATPCGDAVVAVEPPEAPPMPATPAAPVVSEPVATEVIVIPGRVHFAFARTSLSAKTRALLDHVARNLRDATNVRIEITGHTDRHGTAAANRRLGLRRARRVQRYLTAAGIPIDWIRVRTAGESALVQHGRGRKADAENRRVDLRVITGDGRQIRLRLDTDDVQPRRR